MTFSPPEAWASADGYPGLVALLGTPDDVDQVQALLRHLDPAADLTFVLVLSGEPPDWERLEMVVQQAGLTAVKVTASTRLQPHHLYCLAPGTEGSLRHGHLRVQTPRDGTPAVDGFLQSLAREAREAAVVVVLGGDSDDGLRGIQAVKLEAGLTFCSPPTLVNHAHLAGQAIAQGLIDFVMPAREVAGELFRLHRQDVEPTGPEDDVLPRIFPLLRLETGIDFTFYRRNSIRRRVLRRMLFQRIPTLGEYVKLLQERPDEVHALCDDILINVTSFFRDGGLFEALAGETLPRMLHERAPDDPLRIWVPGCSTGQEAYSLGMLLLEFFSQHAVNIPTQIFATDVNAKALVRARTGVYPASIVDEVSELRLHRFFVKLENGWRISKAVRDMCVFARQDLARDPPFSKLDLISCRNVLIYMKPLLQQKIMRVFHYALKPDGCLVLGSSETIGRHSDLFSLLDKRQKIYAKKRSHGASPLDFGRPPQVSDPGKAVDMTPSAEHRTPRSDLDRETEQHLLSRYAPPGVVVDADFEIVQFRSGTGRYLEPRAGPADLNLLKLARPSLVYELRAALQQARTSETLVRRDGVEMDEDGRTRSVSIEVVPLRPGGGPDRFYLVTFEEPASASPPVPLSEDGRAPEVARLQSELSATREYLQSIIEEQEATNEELNSANEEIQSANEELQSTNEELETAKEELQSTNEELTTLNEELFERNAELSRANNDLNNLLASVNLPILMLDPALRIRRFTPLAQKIFNVIASDVGRPIGEIRSNVDIPDLEELLTDVLDSLSSVERTVQHRNGRWYSLRVRPYKTSDNKIDGVVLVLLDIQQFVRTGGDERAMVLLDGDLTVEGASRAFHGLVPVRDGQNVREVLPGVPTDALRLALDGKPPLQPTRLTLGSARYRLILTPMQSPSRLVVVLEEDTREDTEPGPVAEPAPS